MKQQPTPWPGGLRLPINTSIEDLMNQHGNLVNLPPMRWQLSRHLEIDIEGWPLNDSAQQREHTTRAWASSLGLHELDDVYCEGVVDDVTIALSPEPLDDDPAGT
ncbi:hypothetical protein SAMN04489806_0990 [Paramicrobacterium humi]|uniref:Uncharacterized protein n=1 Tax=Paramicrobacterium humi TaxID=640635 RepID=A0A1H4K3M8_9MICO|nr:hypothetical protein [Microbacterium humi]SEB52896.1 hypothetical protein SAMN04489806_0990 [Microbacterium humi]